MFYTKKRKSIIIKRRNISDLRGIVQNVSHYKKYRTIDKLLNVIDECDRHCSEDILVGKAVSYMARVCSVECLNKYM